MRFEFARENPELHLIIGQMPVFAAKWIEGRQFDEIVREAYRLGGRGFVPKVQPTDLLADVIGQVGQRQRLQQGLHGRQVQGTAPLHVALVRVHDVHQAVNGQADARAQDLHLRAVHGVGLLQMKVDGHRQHRQRSQRQ